MNHQKQLLIIISLLCNFSLLAQNIVLPIQHDYANQYERELHQKANNIHTSVKPLASKEIYAIVDSTNESLRLESELGQSNFGNFAFNENLFKIEKEGDYNITGNLLLGFNVGQASDTAYGMFIRGGRIDGSIGEKIYYSSDIHLGNSILPDYLTDQNDDTRTFNGNGALRIYIDDGERQQSTLNATGQVTYQANKYFQFQLGQGKNFIGDGYRSMLLSDYATFYPYFKVQTTFWNIQYTNLYTSMLDVQDWRRTGGRGLVPRKYVMSHYLSWNVTPRLNIGLFETVIYGDSARTRGFDLHYLNPIIFYRPIEFEVGSDGGNALIGFNAKYKITDDIHAYGQFIFDEFSLSRNELGEGCWCNKYGWQLGIKSFNTIISNLTFQTEINSASFYTYSHREVSQNYANSNLPLAHPLGANFIESVSFVRYQKDRWTGKFQLMYALQGLDSSSTTTHFGANINRPFADKDRDTYYGNELLQGIKTATTYADISVGYIINPRSNFHVELGYRYRGFRPEVEVGNLKSTTDSFIYFGFKTNFVNWYYDY